MEMTSSIMERRQESRSGRGNQSRKRQQVLTLSGGNGKRRELLLGLMEYSVSMIDVTQDLCLQPSGLKFAYDSSKPAAPFGSLSRVDPFSVRVNGNPIDPAEVYFLVMNEQVF